MFNWFKSKPVEELAVALYPRGQYSAYWEVFRADVPGGFTAEVRVNSYDKAEQYSSTWFTSPTKDSLQKQINQFLKETMKQYKRA